MAIINFFTIETYDNEYKELLDIDINEELIKVFRTKNEDYRLCTRNKCKASLSNYILNEENKEKDHPKNITYDFAKLSEEYVNSVLVSSTLNNTDTLKELNNKTLQNTTYTNEEFEMIKDVFNKNKNKSFAEYLKDLISLKIDSLFKIYKVILELNLDIEEEDMNFPKYFYENKLNRLKKDSTFFNLLKYNEHIHVLSVIKNTNGYDYNQLREYLNHYIFKDFKIKIKKIYDVNFLRLLSNSDLKSFVFKLKYEDNNTINTSQINGINALKEFVGMTNHQSMTIELKSEKNYQLNNEKILKTYEVLVDNGLVSEVKAKKVNDRSYVDSKSRGAVLSHSSSYKNAKLIDSANLVFLDGYDKKYTNILDILEE